MRYGIVLPGGPATRQLRQAEAAEAAGWDGVLVWEAAYGVDAWALLAAMAARTTTVRLGTLLTPVHCAGTHGTPQGRPSPGRPPTD